MVKSANSNLGEVALDLMQYAKKDIDKAKALANVSRLKIMDILSKQSPLSLSELIRKTNIKKTTLVFHLKKLESAEFIEIKNSKNTLHNPLMITSKYLQR